MKNRIHPIHIFFLLVLMIFFFRPVQAQDEANVQEDRNKPARKAFGSPVLIDNQTDVVNIAKTLEWNIQHRFGTVENGKSDLFGIFAPSNIRLGFSYTPINRLAVGFGMSKITFSNPTIDLNAKFKILAQTQSNSIPVNVTYFGNLGLDTRNKDNFEKEVYRLSYFHELIISRRFGPKFSVQVAPMVAHFNSVDSLYSNDVFGASLGLKFNVSSQGSILFEWTQPINEHDVNTADLIVRKDAGPHPNFALGYEIVTSSHAFQIFFSTYKDLLPQNNLVYNTNSFTKEVGGENKLGFLLGFNLTRLWNF
jgi:hypothetical protein